MTDPRIYGERICTSCGKAFDAKSAVHKTCSVACASKRHYAMRLTREGRRIDGDVIKRGAPRKGFCKTCGQQLDKSFVSKNMVFCGHLCRQTWAENVRHEALQRLRDTRAIPGWLAADPSREAERLREAIARSEML